LYNNIDTLRNKIKGFVSSIGFSGSKIVVLDEADGMSNLLQAALRGFIEEFSGSARFILTANYSEKIIDPLKDRLFIIDFDSLFTKNRQELIKNTAKRLIGILGIEDVEYNREDVLRLIKSTYPSNRALLIKLQNSIQDNVLSVQETDEGLLDLALKAILDKDFNGYMKEMNGLSDPSVIFSEVYKNIDSFSNKSDVIILAAKYSYQDAFARDRLVNSIAFGAELMRR
jgi:replication factor C small subunit